MDYATMLKLEAAKTVEGLAANVVELEKQVAKIEDRILFERGDIDRREEDMARFKDAAAAKLATSTSAYCEWQARFRKLTVDLAAARDALALLETVIAPKTKLAREVAREKLSQALTALCLAARPSCEARMAELLDGVVAEHDAFLAACVNLHLDHGCTFSPPPFYHPGGPRCQHARIAHAGKHVLTDSAMYVAFTLPPAPAEAPPVHLPAPEAAPVDVGDRRTATDSTISAPPDTGAVPEQAPNAVQGVQGPEKSAQDAPGATNGERPDTQDAPDADPEKKGTTPITGLDALDALDLEAQDCADVDAEYQADLDGDAPPDAGKENPGIAAELDAEAPSTPTTGETVKAADPPSA